MTELLDQAFKTASALPPEMQDEMARVLLQLAGQEQPVYHLTPEERADLAEAQAEFERGEFATDAEVRAVWLSMACEDQLYAERATAAR